MGQVCLHLCVWGGTKAVLLDSFWEEGGRGGGVLLPRLSIHPLPQSCGRPGMGFRSPMTG